MNVRLGNGLLLANILSWLLIALVLVFPESPLRIVLGIPFVLFFPGYALITALVPRKGGMTGIERLALSFGLSIALVILIGLALNYTPFGIRLNPVMFSTAGVITALSIVAWSRQRGLPEDERFSISLQLSKAAVWSGQPIDKVLSVVLVVAILASIGAVAYTIAKPKPGEEFTEFYILGSGGKAADYPSTLIVGQTANVTGGIVNNFRAPAVYRVEIVVGGVKQSETGPLTLQPKEKWEGPFSFTSDNVGSDQKVEFLLYKDSGAEPSESLHLWVDVVR